MIRDTHIIHIICDHFSVFFRYPSRVASSSCLNSHHTLQITLLQLKNNCALTPKMVHCLPFSSCQMVSTYTFSAHHENHRMSPGLQGRWRWLDLRSLFYRTFTGHRGVQSTESTRIYYLFGHRRRTTRLPSDSHSKRRPLASFHGRSHACAPPTTKWHISQKALISRIRLRNRS